MEDIVINVYNKLIYKIVRWLHSLRVKNPEVDQEITGANENTCALFMGESLRSSAGTCLYFLPRFFNPQKLGDADWRGEAVFNYEEKKWNLGHTH